MTVTGSVLLDCFVICKIDFIFQMLWGGSVADPERQEDSTVAIRNLNKKVHTDDRVYCSLLKLGDGTNIVFKK